MLGQPIIIFLACCKVCNIFMEVVLFAEISTFQKVSFV